MTDETTLPQVMSDDEMETLVQCHLYSYDGEYNAHATPNYRYCQPSTPCYRYVFGEGYWEMENA